MNRQIPLFRSLVILLVAAASAGAGFGSVAEIHSNGLGGGNWSDPGSWRGRAVPGSNDLVVVAGDDHLVVDLVDTNRVACGELTIDPRGMLSFQKGGPHTALIVGGPVESYGAIRMDLADLDDGAAELRLVSTNAPGRYVHLRRGGSLIVNGRRDLPEGERNVWLVSAPPAGDPAGHVQAGDQSALELQGAGIRNVRVYAASIDNTGGSPGERCNVIGCWFTGQGGVALQSCDSAVVADNEFVRGSDWAIESWYCALTEIRRNRIRHWRFGMGFAYGSDNWFTSNTIENVHFAFRHQGPAMLQGNLSWSFDAAGKYLPPPAYTLEVLGPAPGPDKPEPVLKTVTVTPAESWYRPRPNDPAPTVEVTVP